MTTVSFGLIGASYVAATRVVPAIRAEGGTVKALFDSDEHRFRHWEDEHLDVITDDLDTLLRYDVDAVYISSRNDQHAAHAIAAARAGKHILLEKPMALTVSDARDIVSAAAQAQVVLAVNHHLPGSPLHTTARQLVADGRIGTLLSARINHAVLLPEHLREWRISTSPGGGVAFDITVHDASVLNPLFATEPLRVAAIGASQAAWNTAGTIDALMTTIVYAAARGGVPGLAQTHDAFCVPFPGTSMEIHGDRGAITIRDAMTQETPGTVTLHSEAGDESIDVDCSADLYSINVAAFSAAIRGEGRPTATGADGVRALQVGLAAETSLSTGAVIDIADLR